MINKLFNKVFLSKQENEINVITGDLGDYWKRTNDFSLACLRYLQDLNTKFELGFNAIELTEIVSTVIMKCYSNFGLSNANTMLIFGEFVYYGIFNGKLPSYVRNRKETIQKHLENFENYVIENPKPWNNQITKVLDRSKFIP